MTKKLLYFILSFIFMIISIIFSRVGQAHGVVWVDIPASFVVVVSFILMNIFAVQLTLGGLKRLSKWIKSHSRSES